MTLKQLRSFVAAARLGSFTAAAASMDVAQASVSELIRKVEDEEGVALFVRGARRLLLTSAGSTLLPFAERALAAVDEGAHALRALRSLQGGVVTFGLLRNAAFYVLSDLVQHFHVNHPNVRVRLVGLNSVEVAEEVAAGTVEAGLVVLPVEDAALKVTPLLRDEVLYVSGDPARAARPVTVADLAQARLVLYDAHYGWRDPTRRQLAERSQLAGVRIEPWVEVEHVEPALELVARGVGDTVVSRAVAKSPSFPAGLHTVGFEEPMYDTIALVHRQGTELSPAAREMARLARRMLLRRQG
ncbi:LysR family transcriptional regulator [Streptomyces tsukubensis]|uniref:LysR family transcriptional regulator n=1 Tax=Streptomyces tsukubensis TaxID=83656 RepID=A0A1V4AER3_9ACTN|nr:LysR family transcriptional regulator [Streptomyces tsukubensis]QFR98153.1 LysR family transcriptional regulator [Streptomyces tsukubensis]